MPKKGIWCIHSDPCGICCATFTYLLLIFADYVVTHAVLTPWLDNSPTYYLVAFSFVLISFLAMGSHCRTMLTDPGAVPIDYQPSALLAAEQGNAQLPMCSRCNGLKPPRAHHCSQCDRCIMKMDHHCPWVNNCVGVNNQKHFVLFTFYTALLSAYAMLLLFLRAMGSANPRPPPGFDPHAPRPRQHIRKMEVEAGRFLLMGLLFFEAILFGLFTLAMCSEQLSSIMADQTGIERLKSEYAPDDRDDERRSWLHNLSETFGRPISVLWLLPTQVKYHGLTWLDLLPMECEV